MRRSRRRASTCTWACGRRRCACENGDVVVELDGPAGPLRGEQLLVATGRKLNTDEIGLETVGLEPGRPIEVDDQMRANDWLYAIGDVNGRALLTHMGKYQARVAADVILGEDNDLPGLGRRALAARDLHRSPGGGRRLHARRRRATPASTSASSTCRPRQRRGRPSTAVTTRAARRAWSSTRTGV